MKEVADQSNISMLTAMASKVFGRTSEVLHMCFVSLSNWATAVLRDPRRNTELQSMKDAAEALVIAETTLESVSSNLHAVSDRFGTDEVVVWLPSMAQELRATQVEVDKQLRSLYEATACEMMEEERAELEKRSVVQLKEYYEAVTKVVTDTGHHANRWYVYKHTAYIYICNLP